MKSTVSDSQIISEAKNVVARFKSAAVEYKEDESKSGLLGMFVGHVMKALPDADANIVTAFTKKELDRINPFEKTAAEKAMLKELKSQYKNQAR